MISTLKTQIAAMTPEPWQRTLWVMFFAQLCTAVGFSMIFPFLPLYVADLGTNTSISIEFWAGMVFSAQAVTMMFASPIWGALADRYGRKMMVQRAMFGGAIVTFLMAFAGTAEELVFLRAVQGLITGTVSAANALVAASAPRERTGYAMSVIQVGLWGGVALGPLLGGVLADAFGFRIPFMITGVMLGISGVIVFFAINEEITPETKAANKRKGFVGEWRHIFSMPGVRETYVVRFLSGLTRSMIIPILPLFVASLLMSGAMTLQLPPGIFDVFGVTGGVSTYTGLVIGVTSATATLSAIQLGRLGDRIGHRLILIACAGAALVLYIPQAFVTSALQLLILQAITGLAMGGIVAAPSALLARYTEPGEEGAVYGLDNSVIAAARAIAPLAGAGIAFWLGLRATFLAMTGVFLLVMLVAALLLPNDAKAVERIAATKDEPEGKLQPSPTGD